MADDDKRMDEQTRPPYEPPRIEVYSWEELLMEFGPAQACTGI